MKCVCGSEMENMANLDEADIWVCTDQAGHGKWAEFVRPALTTDDVTALCDYAARMTDYIERITRVLNPDRDFYVAASVLKALHDEGVALLPKKEKK